MLHVGNARTALFDWMYARRNGGVNLLRIEDTDDSRNNPAWVDVIYRSLEWLGLDWDGEPSFQSATLDAHRETAEKLYADGKAYYCECTSEDAQRRNAAKGIKTPGYDSFCSDRGLGPGEGRALRFRVPDEGTITRVDLIRGTSELALADIEDFVILRANGTPLYAFANCLDDIADGITHVLRGEDHLANVPKQMLLREAVGAGEITWAHLPMIVNEQRKKLSKRRDRVALESFRDDGYLPEAMVNYLATLGWMPPSELGEELATLETMTQAFDLADVNSAPAAFDMKKLAAFNGFYIRGLPVDEFIERARPFFGHPVLERMADSVQTRVERLSDLPDMLGFFGEAFEIDHADWEKDVATAAHGKPMLVDAAEAYRSCEWNAEALHAVTAQIGERLGIGLKKAQAPIRVAVTGRRVGPPLFESLEVLGREESLVRIEAALAKLG